MLWLPRVRAAAAVASPKVPRLTIHEAVEKAVGFAPVSIHGDHCQHLRALGNRSSGWRLGRCWPHPAIEPASGLHGPLFSGELRPLALQGLSATRLLLCLLPTSPTRPSALSPPPASPLFSPMLCLWRYQRGGRRLVGAASTEGSHVKAGSGFSLGPGVLFEGVAQAHS